MSVNRTRNGRVQAKVRIDDVDVNVGTYDSETEAHAAMVAERERIRLGTSVLLRANGEVLDRRAYAARVGVPLGTLGRWLSEGLPSLAVGLSAVRIDVAVADAWIAERHPRSVSFAREAVVYFMQRDTDDAIKIGFTSDVLRRVPELRKKGYPVVLLAAVPGDKSFEGALHGKFADERLDPKDEWFRASDRLLAFIASLGRSAA